LCYLLKAAVAGHAWQIFWVTADGLDIATCLATLAPNLEDMLSVLRDKRGDVLAEVSLPPSMAYSYGSSKATITLAFVSTTASKMTAANESIAYLLIAAGF